MQACSSFSSAVDSFSNLGSLVQTSLRLTAIPPIGEAKGDVPATFTTAGQILSAPSANAFWAATQQPSAHYLHAAPLLIPDGILHT